MDIQPANAMFLYYSFGVVGLETFIISEGSKVINKILFGQEKFKISDDKVTVVKTNFSRAVFENLLDKEKSKLNQFAMLHKVMSTKRLFIVDDRAQNIESD